VNLKTDKIEYVYRFPEDIAGPTSMLNDLVIDKKNGFIYIADSSLYVPVGEPLNGALIIVDIK